MGIYRDNENGIKNPNRVYAAKQAHKKYHNSYRQGAEKMSRLGQSIANLEKELKEAEVEDKSQLNLSSDIKLDTLPVAFTIRGDKENPNDFTIALMVTEDGNALFTQESQEADDIMAEDTFNQLTEDFKTLAENLDRDIDNILKKNGLVKKSV